VLLKASWIRCSMSWAASISHFKDASRGFQSRRRKSQLRSELVSRETELPACLNSPCSGAAHKPDLSRYHACTGREGGKGGGGGALPL